MSGRGTEIKTEMGVEMEMGADMGVDGGGDGDEDRDEREDIPAYNYSEYQTDLHVHLQQTSQVPPRSSQ